MYYYYFPGTRIKAARCAGGGADARGPGTGGAGVRGRRRAGVLRPTYIWRQPEVISHLNCEKGETMESWLRSIRSGGSIQTTVCMWEHAFLVRVF